MFVRVLCGRVTDSGLRMCVSGKPSSTTQVFYNRLKFHLFEQEKDIEDFITSLDSQEKSRSPPVGLEGKLDGSGKSESTTFFFFLLSAFTVSESREQQEWLRVPRRLPSAGICPLRCVCPRHSVLCVWTFGLVASVALWKLRAKGPCLQPPRPSCLELGAAGGSSRKARDGRRPRAAVGL